MTSSGSNPPAGWYRDPAGGGGERFWDGVAWSQSTRDAPTPAPHDGPAPCQPDAAPYAQPQAYQPFGYAAGPVYAGFWWRVLGYIIDSVILSLALYLLNLALPVNDMVTRSMERWQRAMLIWAESSSGPFPMPDAQFWWAMLWSTLLGVVVYAIYRIVFLGYLSATPGQLAVGLRVVKDGDEPTARLGWGPAIVRGLAGALLWELVGFINGIFAAFLSKRQALSDLISNTVVYKVR